MKNLLTVHLKTILSFLAGALAALSISGLLASTDGNPAQSFEEYQKLLAATPVLLDEGQADDTKGVITRSLVAFLARDAEGSVAELSEDYSWNKITPDGAVKMVTGTEPTLEITKNLYESDFFESYLGVHSTPLGIIGNLGAQYEVEEWINDDGSKRVLRTLAIYEIKDGKLWRLWAFQPFLGDSDPES
jgi:hypothetical protein